MDLPSDSYIDLPSLAAGIILGLIPFLRSTIIAWITKKRIERWIRNNTEDNDGKRFKDTRTICNALNLEPEKVAKSCYSSKIIKRNIGERESWTIYNQPKDENPKIVKFL